MSLQLTDAQKGYLAGALDGEGCLHHRRDRRGNLQFVLEVANTHEGFIKYVSQLIKGRPYLGSPSWKRFSRKPCFHVRVNKRDMVIELLTALLPYLIIKREKAQEMLRLAKESLPIIGTEEYRRRVSEAIKRKWQDPEYRTKMLKLQRTKSLQRWYRDREPIETHVDDIVRLYQDGASIKCLAIQYGCSSSTIRRLLIKHIRLRPFSEAVKLGLKNKKTACIFSSRGLAW